MKMKKWIAVIVAAGMVLTLLAACGNSEGGQSAQPAQTQAAAQADQGKTDDQAAAPAQEQAAAPAAEDDGDEGSDEDIADVNVMFWTLNIVPSDIEMVEDAINEVIEPKIHANIHLIITEMGSYIEQVNLMMASQEKLDLMVTLPGGPAHFNQMTAQKQLQDLTDLLPQYAPELLELVPATWLEGTSIDGRIYAVTPLAEKGSPMSLHVRKDLLEETGFDPESLKNADNLEAMMLKIKELHPELSPMAPGSKKVLTTPWMIGLDGYFTKFDSLGEGDNAIVSIMPGEGDVIVNNYTREVYKHTSEVLKRWYDEGLIYKDGVTRSEPASDLVNSGVCACYFNLTGTGGNSAQTVASGHEMVQVKMGESSILGTGDFRKFTWAVPVSATEPEAAVKLMNLLFTDAEVLNLLTWGIEGVHYQTLADGTIDFLDGEDPSSCGYFLGDVSAIFGNGFLAKVRAGQDPDLREQWKANSLSSEVSRYNGFSFDTSSVSNEVAGITNTVETYRPYLATGAFEWDYYDEFIKQLEDNGVDLYIQTIQEQLDAWLAANNK